MRHFFEIFRGFAERMSVFGQHVREKQAGPAESAGGFGGTSEGVIPALLVSAKAGSGNPHGDREHLTAWIPACAGMKGTGMLERVSSDRLPQPLGLGSDQSVRGARHQRIESRLVA